MAGTCHLRCLGEVRRVVEKRAVEHYRGYAKLDRFLHKCPSHGVIELHTDGLRGRTREAQRRLSQRREPAVVADTVLRDLKHYRQFGPVGRSHECLRMLEKDDIEGADRHASARGRTKQVGSGRESHDGVGSRGPCQRSRPRYLQAPRTKSRNLTAESSHCSHEVRAMSTDR